jgi:DNA-binding NarL/FixJ family response regulator
MSDTAPVRVVLVDDAVEIRELLGSTLARASDFDVVAEAADGVAGVRAVADTLPDLVLLDISMPVMDGLEALQVIRAECPDALVVMFSGFGDSSEVARQSVRLGAHGYIRKGDTMSGLTDQLRAVIAAAREHGDRSESAEDSAGGSGNDDWPTPPPGWPAEFQPRLGQ